MLHAVKHVTGGVLWANLFLLFWLSLVPFTTAWMSYTGFQQWPVAIYGAVLFLAGCSYYLLSRLLIRHHGKESALFIAVGRDRKGLASMILYIVGIALSFVDPHVSILIYIGVVLMWLYPDRRIERTIEALEKTR